MRNQHIIINTMENLGVSFNILQLKANKETQDIFKTYDIDKLSKSIVYNTFTINHNNTKDKYLIAYRKQQLIINCLKNYLSRNITNTLNKIRYFKEWD